MEKMGINKVDKETYLNIVMEKLSNASLENKSSILNRLLEKLPSDLYDLSIGIIDDVLGLSDISLDDVNERFNSIKEKFELIEEHELCFNSYAYETGTYSYFGDDYDYEYYDNEGISKVLEEAYSFGTYLINNKKYALALKVFDLIIYTNYFCEETSDPLYNDSDEVIDCYDIDLEQVEGLLNFDLKHLYSYAVYAAYFSDDRYQKIYDYLSIYDGISFENCVNFGIEKLNNLSEFYQKWISFLSEKNDKLSEKLIKESISEANIDEYFVCKQNFKTHPTFYKEYVEKLMSDKNYGGIIKTYDEAISEIVDEKIREYITYMMIDAVNNSGNELSICKYYYTIFESVKSIPNFLVLLHNDLVDDEIKRYISSLSYGSDGDDRSYYDFFLGDFERVYTNKFENCNKIDICIFYLVMLYLGDTKELTDIKEYVLEILQNDFEGYHFRHLNIDIGDDYEGLLKAFDDWKVHHEMDEILKNRFINRIKLMISNECVQVLGNKKQYYYLVLARYVVMFDNVLANNNYMKAGEYISTIHKEYVKYRSFRKELKSICMNEINSI